MFNYSPRVYDFFVPVVIFAIAEATRKTSWQIFGVVMYGVGALSMFVIIYAFISEIHHNTRDDNPSTDDDDLKHETATTHVVISDGRGNMKLFDLHASPRQLERLAVGLLIAGDKFTQRKWSGKGRPFSRTQFETLTQTMIEKGLAYQINEQHPQQGYDLTLVGKNYLKKYLPHSPTEYDTSLKIDDVSHARTDARTDAQTTALKG